MQLIDKENGIMYSYPSIILIPKIGNETARSKYYVYRDLENNLIVSIANSHLKNNFEGYEKAQSIGEFDYDNCYELASYITNRPVFAALIDENRKILAYEVINGYDASLDDYLDDSYKKLVKIK